VAESASISHATSGRLRIRVRGHPEEVDRILDRIAERAGAHPDVAGVRTDARTGSALVTWDPQRLDLATVVDLCRTAHAALQDLVAPVIQEAVDEPVSQAAERLIDRLTTANRGVMRATGGRADLRFLLPTTFAVASIRQLLRTGPAFPSIPWYVLAYYAFDSFIKLHGTGSTSPGDQPGP
jgi:hypothetical protein